MKWLQANPVGMTLAGIGGFLVLVALVMAVVWTLPVSVEPDENAGAEISGTYSVAMAEKLEDLREYEVINQRPVFNESRLPVIIDESDEGGLEDESVDPEIAVTDAPNVKLTGIVITPGMKLASLTPNDGGAESVMAYEGDALTGEYLGWQISQVNTRSVVLKSLNGQTLELELEVHDTKIQEPPKPAAPPKQVAEEAVEPKATQGETPAAATDDDEPMSRAEQIRQRIAERREELRREQEQAQQQTDGGRSNRAPRRTDSSAYQNAIRARINNNARKTSDDDDTDG